MHSTAATHPPQWRKHRNVLCRLAHVLGTQPLSTIAPTTLFADPSTAVVHLNGTILGVHHSPRWFVHQLRCARRAGALAPFVAVHLQPDAVHIACDGGRLCRPLVVCDDGVPRLTQAHVEVRFLRGVVMEVAGDLRRRRAAADAGAR